MSGRMDKDTRFEKFEDTRPIWGRFVILAKIPLPPKIRRQWDESFYHEIDLGGVKDRWFMGVRDGVLMFRVETKDPQRAMRAIMTQKRYAGASEVQFTIVPSIEDHLMSLVSPREFSVGESDEEADKSGASRGPTSRQIRGRRRRGGR